MRPSTRFARRSAFVRYAAVAYVAVVVYASLYPLAGWRAPSHEMLWVRLAEWPRFYTYSDVFLNVLAYAPLGLLLTLMLRTRFGGMHAATLAMAFATGLSFAMEVLQAWVPVRVPSALDVFCNAVGGLVGAWTGIAVAEPLLRGGRLSRWRERRLVAGASADVGLTLLALWLFTHLNAALWLFGTGDARQFFPALAATYTPDAYIALEAGVTGFALVAVAGLAGIIARDGVMLLIVPVVLIALVLKSAASLFLFNPGQPFLWITPGAGIGLVGGTLLAGALLRLGIRARAAGGLVGLAVSVALLNIAPANPYLEETLQVWRHGHFWSFTGTTAIVSMLWPLAAATFLLISAFKTPRGQ
ncbi:MAG: VanZ family protein [Betaproteobacteria bacterium]